MIRDNNYVAGPRAWATAPHDADCRDGVPRESLRCNDGECARYSAVRLVVTKAGQIGTMRSAISRVERRCATMTREIGRRRIALLIARSFSSSRWLVALSSSTVRGARRRARDNPTR